jgi:nucleoside-diphosphate-sugar epimerase
VLVTGASGFVGGAAAGRLAEGGHDVIGLSRRPGAVAGLHGLLDANLADPALAARVAERVEPCAAIVHAGASLDRDPRRAAQMVLANCLGTEQVLELGERWKVERFVFVSSLPVIGRPRELPVTEYHPTAPATAYHATKLLGEHLCLAGPVAERCAVLRLTSPVGPGMPGGRIVSELVGRALASEPLELAGAGTRRQDYVDVRDVAAAVEAALAGSAHGRFNVAAGRSVANRELAELVLERLGSTSAIRLGAGDDPDDGVRWEVSIQRARDELGWAPAIALAESIDAVAAELTPSRGRSAGPPAATS